MTPATARDTIQAHLEEWGFTALTLAEVERALILAVLKKEGNNRRRAAASLGISESTLRRRLSDYRTLDGAK